MSSEEISPVVAIKNDIDPADAGAGWDTVFKKSCLGTSHCNGNVELSGSFTYCQKNCVTQEERDVIIEAFTRMIKDSIQDAGSVKQQ